MKSCFSICGDFPEFSTRLNNQFGLSVVFVSVGVRCRAAPSQKVPAKERRPARLRTATSARRRTPRRPPTR